MKTHTAMKTGYEIIHSHQCIAIDLTDTNGAISESMINLTQACFNDY